MLFQFLKPVIDDIFNMTAYEKGAKFIYILLNIVGDLGILSLVCIHLCKKIAQQALVE